MGLSRRGAPPALQRARERDRYPPVRTAALRADDYWPTADENPTAPPYEVEYANIWKRVPKVVFSKTLRRVEWNSRVVAGDALVEVARLKEEPGKNMSIGGTALASALAEGGLIDEFRFYVVPIVLGGGVPMLRQLRERIKLTLVEVQTFASGTVLLRYRRSV